MSQKIIKLKKGRTYADILAEEADAQLVRRFAAKRGLIYEPHAYHPDHSPENPHYLGPIAWDNSDGTYTTAEDIRGWDL